MKHPFTTSELITIFEAARLGMTGAGNLDELAAHLDIADEAMVELRDKLQNFMDNPQMNKYISARDYCESNNISEDDLGIMGECETDEVEDIAREYLMAKGIDWQK